MGHLKLDVQGQGGGKRILDVAGQGEWGFFKIGHMCTVPNMVFVSSESTVNPGSSCTSSDLM